MRLPSKNVQLHLISDLSDFFFFCCLEKRKKERISEFRFSFFLEKEIRCSEVDFSFPGRSKYNEIS